MPVLAAVVPPIVPVLVSVTMLPMFIPSIVMSGWHMYVDRLTDGDGPDTWGRVSITDNDGHANRGDRTVFEESSGMVRPGSESNMESEPNAVIHPAALNECRGFP